MSDRMSDKELWSLAKRMFNEQTEGLPVRTWETSSPETRVQWRKAAQFVAEKGPHQDTRIERIMRCLDTIVRATWNALDRADHRRVYELDWRYVLVEDVLIEEREKEAHRG